MPLLLMPVNRSPAGRLLGARRPARRLALPAAAVAPGKSAFAATVEAYQQAQASAETAASAALAPAVHKNAHGGDALAGAGALAAFAAAGTAVAAAATLLCYPATYFIVCLRHV